MKSNDRPNSFIFQGCLNQSESKVALVVKILIVKVIQAGSIVQEVIAMGVMTSTIVERWLPICIVSRFQFETIRPTCYTDENSTT